MNTKTIDKILDCLKEKKENLKKHKQEKQWLYKVIGKKN